MKLQCIGLPRREAGESGPSRRELDVCSVSHQHHFIICVNQRIGNLLGPSKPSDSPRDTEAPELYDEGIGA